MELQTLPVEQAIQESREQSLSLVEKAQSLVVENQEEADLANILLKRINAGIKAIEAKRMEVIRPQREAMQNLNDMFRPITDAAKKAMADLKQRLMDYRLREQQRIAAEQAAAEEAAQKELERRQKIQASHEERGHKVKEDVAPVAIEQVAPLQDSTTVQKRWTFDVLDVKKLPREYLLVDKVAIRDAMRKAVREDTIDDFNVPGVRFYQKETGMF